MMFRISIKPIVTKNCGATCSQKPGTHDASKHATCLVDGDARTTSNICTRKRRLC